MSAQRRSLVLACLLGAGQLAFVAHAQPVPASPTPTPAATAHAHAPASIPAAAPVAPAPVSSVAPPVAPGASTPATSVAPAAPPELRPVPRSEDGTESTAPATTPAHDTKPKQGFGVDVQLGFGVGTTRFERPLPDATSQELPDSAFAAIDTGLRLHLPDYGRMSLSAALRYRSSLGFRIEESPLFALDSSQDVRVQRIELSARSLWRVGDGGWSPALGVELGVVIATFVPELHDRLTPKYALAGPLLRPVGRIEPLPWLSLQLGPELTWIAVVDGSLGEDGTGVGEQGLALGAEATVRARLFEGLSLELDARSAIAVVDSDGERVDFQDVARYVTLGLVGEL